jgi:hypothetical protein
MEEFRGQIRDLRPKLPHDQPPYPSFPTYQVFHRSHRLVRGGDVEPSLAWSRHRPNVFTCVGSCEIYHEPCLHEKGYEIFTLCTYLRDWINNDEV